MSKVTPKPLKTSAKAFVEALDASGFLKKLTAELAAGEVQLPSYPDFAAKVQRAMEDPRAASASIAQVVGADAALAGRVLRLANSAFLNPSGHRITDLPRAVTQLGRQLVRCTALSFALKQMELHGPASLRTRLHELWRDGILVASISFVLARETRAASPDEALVAGLMHNIGRLYITVNAQRVTLDDAHHDEWNALIEEWHPWMARAILKQWGFPPAIIAAVGDQHNDTPGDAGGPLADILIASTALVPAVFYRQLLDDTITAVPSFARLGLSTADCKRLLGESAKQIRLLQSTLSG